MSWPNLSDLLVASGVDAPVGLVGAPLAAGSVTPGRCDLAPGTLRKVLVRIGRYDTVRLPSWRGRASRRMPSHCWSAAIMR